MNCPTFIFFFSRASQTWKERQQRVPDLYRIIQNTDFQIDLVLQASPNIKKKAIKIKGYLKMFTELKYINYCSRCRIFMQLNPQKSAKFSGFVLISPSSIWPTFKWDTIPGGLNLGRGVKWVWVFIRASFSVCGASFISRGRAHARPGSTPGTANPSGGSSRGARNGWKRRKSWNGWKWGSNKKVISESTSARK